MTIEQATLFSKDGQRDVDLPNVLSEKDFAPQGSMVRYRLSIDLPNAPDKPIGVYVPKVSLAGKLYVNGLLAAICATGQLEKVRCLHQPNLFEIPANFWKQGTNSLEFEVYATNRQMNGLSSVTIGDTMLLYQTFYKWEHFLKVDLLTGLAWLSAILGLLSLSMSLIHRHDRVYLWFGITSIVNALGSLNGIVTEPPVNIDLFNWFVFSIRLISVPLLYMTFIVVFKKERPWIIWSTVLFVVLAPLAIWLSNNNHTLTFALYIPMLLLGPVLMIAIFRWSIQKANAIYWILALLLPGLFTCGLIDWLRLGGRTNFEGIYLASYGYGLLLLVIWILRIIDAAERKNYEAELIKAHDAAESAKKSLEIANRELQQLTAAQIEQSRLKEREQLLQDMHDGFGSQLASIRIMAENGRITADQLPVYLSEITSDLHLIVDTLSQEDITLESALTDMRYRTQRRLQKEPLNLHWDIALENKPHDDSRLILHILRIMQEAFNNAIRHANPKNIWLSAKYDQTLKQVTIKVKDDGSGMPREFRMGRGLSNMQQRAREIGARLERIDHQTGTEIRLTLNTNTMAG